MASSMRNFTALLRFFFSFLVIGSSSYFSAKDELIRLLSAPLGLLDPQLSYSSGLLLVSWLGGRSLVVVPKSSGCSSVYIILF